MKTETKTELLHKLEGLGQMGSVLYIAAHPDDENTELLGYLSRGRNYRTAYLSMTRGDGGQNVLGADLGKKLGIARTQELLAARQIDGAQQFFTRAIDFGYSKNYTETLNVWNKQEILSDIVRIIREFHPDIIITRFSPSPGGTHGHHTASSVLALEAFKLAADPKAFPEQQLPPWQAKRILWNVSHFQRDKALGIDAFKIDIGGRDPVTDELFTDIAGKSRAMHKTQGFDSFKISGATGGQRLESFHVMDGAPAGTDIMDGVDCSWKRIAGGSEIDESIKEITSHFNSRDAAASVPGLLKLKEQLSALHMDDPAVKAKQQQVDRILQECVGLEVETSIPQAEFVPGEALKLHHTAIVRSKIPVRFIGVRYPLLKKEAQKNVELHPNEKLSFDSVETLPATASLSQPWWLRVEGTAGTFGFDDPKLIGSAENPPAFPIEDEFEISGQKLVVRDEPVYTTTNAAGTRVRRRMDVITPVSLRFVADVALLAPGGKHKVEVEVTAARAHLKGTLELVLPADWKAEPAKQAFQLAITGEKARIGFTIVAPAISTTARITAKAVVGGVPYSNQRQQVNYSHIPPQMFQPQAVLKAASLDLVIHGKRIGYLPGAGDSLPENLQEMGCEVKTLDEGSLTEEQLHGLDAVVLGVRAFNVRKTISESMPALFNYVKNGGTVIVQYNRPDKLMTEKIAPYELKISSDRVTDENAAVTFLAPENPVLNTPNKISKSDFEGWVQERGLYFPNQWDEHFQPILQFNDPGEAPVKGALLVAPYGKGYYIYTGLGFFRQLPAGVPGAYRLFANLVSINK